MKEDWKELIVLLCSICDSCEDGHLNSYGESFFAAHKMFEDIKDSVESFPDLIQETYCGAREIPFIPSRDIREMELAQLKIIRNGKDAAKHIKNLLINALDKAKEIDSNEDVTLGEKDVLSKITGTLQQKLYFIQNYLK